MLSRIFSKRLVASNALRGQERDFSGFRRLRHRLTINFRGPNVGIHILSLQGPEKCKIGFEKVRITIFDASSIVASDEIFHRNASY